MTPTFSNGLPDIRSLPSLFAVNVWSHAILGILAEVIGFLIVEGFWVSKLISNMRCMRIRKWMMPLFIVWLYRSSMEHLYACADARWS